MAISETITIRQVTTRKFNVWHRDYFVRLFCDICWQYYVIDTSRVLVIFPLRRIINFRRKMVRRC